MACEDSLELSDNDADYEAEPDHIEFKASPEWKAALAELNSVLSDREHWPGGAERKDKRRQRGNRSSKG